MPTTELIRHFRSAWAVWCHFWFRDMDVRSMAVIRIGLGFMLTYTTIELFPMLEVLAGPNGIYSAPGAARELSAVRWSWFDAFNSMTAVYVAHSLALLVNVLFLLGIKAQWTGFLSVVTTVALYQRNSWFMNGGDRLIREMALYLCLVPSGAVYSVEAWWRRRRCSNYQPVTRVSIVSARLIQLQVAFMYCSSGFLKAAGTSWQEGTALYYALSTRNYIRSEGLVAPLTETELGQQICKVLSDITLYWEIGFPLLVIWRPTRYLALLIGVAVHGGIEAMLCVAWFGCVSVLSYVAYLPDGWIDRVVAWTQRR